MVEREPIKKICPWCHKEFETTNPRVKFCSKACYRKANNAKHRSQEVVCQICGKVFYGAPNYKYCSDECKKIGVTRMIEERRKKKQTGRYYICPRCKKKHKQGNKRIDSKWQYCKTCRYIVDYTSNYDENWIYMV